ncbi:uncharacterized protein SCDLUD_000112 [Saccharomycodes ludwigii]|uniref:uncharacterized protein n=1 Tax=Saccharomycodes ludwigii TaxID=36035 RepID=UPI001E8525B4|nr:hypothetical protein SCDLUD_000112 [Saccharomycodes ludwigii]KAH3902533.1 hypothetical protein SCDLUD_000112 [Saccharomycodes ludwigii]
MENFYYFVISECLTKNEFSPLFKNLLLYSAPPSPLIGTPEDISNAQNYNAFLFEPAPDSYSIHSKNGKIRDLIDVSLKLKYLYREYPLHATLQKFVNNSNKTVEPRVVELLITKLQEYFSLCDSQLKKINRLAEGEKNWITKPMYLVASQLYSIANLLDAYFFNDNNNVMNNKKDKNLCNTNKLLKSHRKQIGDLDDETFLEKCNRTIHNSFKLCLNDREPDTTINKKLGVYPFILLEFSTYEKLNNFDMEKSFIKVLMNRLNTKQLPSLKDIPGNKNFELLWFNFFMGKYFIRINDPRCVEYLMESYQYCNIKCTKMIVKILDLLAPCYLKFKNKLLKFPFTQETGIPHELNKWLELYKILKNGEIFLFKQWCFNQEKFLLANKLFIIVCADLKNVCFTRLLHKYWALNNNDTKVNLQELNAIWRAASKEIRGKDNDIENELDELECILNNLIIKKYINGYLSHGNRYLVLSKKTPFPSIYTI